jgi:hypothetical protein
MLTSEDQAKDKWCPMVRTAIYAGDNGVAINHHVDEKTYVEETRCKGSACMMWRWSKAKPKAGWCGIAGVPAG